MAQKPAKKKTRQRIVKTPKRQGSVSRLKIRKAVQAVKNVTEKEKEFVSRKISKLRGEGVSQKQAVGAAFGHVKQRRKKKK